MRTDYGQRNEIAIVGMAGRFPAADDVDELWRMVMDGRDGVRELDLDELRAAGVPDELSSAPGYVPFATEVSGAADFDAEFFGLTPAEAECTDPQHRLMMECAWHALEDAGAPASGRIGVFVSTESHTYLEQHLLPREKHTGPDLPYRLRLTNQPEFLATRLSYALGITGPAMSISTACSSSLVGVDTACTALIMRRCDVAIAGAAALRLPQASGYLYREGGTWSRDGRCRPFDAGASGWIAGNGGGAVVLKRLADAVADRDRVYAVITGVGVNNDGADKISFAAPSTSAQVDVITAAIADAGVPSSDVGYVEAHGSGTVLGDPIEVTALAKAYSAAGGVAPGCGLGSVKANLGHLACAAGMAGLIKTALVLHHQRIPPQANLAEPNPLLRLDASGFTIHDRPHRPDGGIRAAAVTSLGMGGTNAHMILTAAPAPPAHRPAPADRAYPLPVSARTPRDLRAVAANLRRHLRTHDVRIDDLAYTLTHGRTRFPVTATVRARTVEEAVVALDHLQPTTNHPDQLPARDDFGPAVKITLPGHPLHRRRHWVDAPRQAPARPSRGGARAGALLDEIVTVFRSHLGIDDLGPDDEFDAAGGSSMTALEIVDAISQRLGAVISLSRFLQLGTPRRITDEIRTWPGGNLVDPTIVRLRDGAPGQEIFFIYPVNGTAFCYHRMAPLFTFDKPVYAVSYPFGEPDPPRTVPEMAARCIADLRSVAPHGPYRLAGYLMGGNLAVEMAAQLAKEGERVTDIVMIDAVPAEAYPPRPVPVDYLRAAGVTMSYFLGVPVPTHVEKLSTVDDVLAVLRRPTWTSRTQQIMRQCVESLVANAMAISVTSPATPVDADITVLSAAERSNPAYEVVGIKSLPPESWQRHTTGTVTSVVVPGNHYTLYTEHFDDLVGAFNQVYRD